MGQLEFSAESLGFTEADFGQKTWQAVLAELVYYFTFMWAARRSDPPQAG